MTNPTPSLKEEIIRITGWHESDTYLYSDECSICGRSDGHWILEDLVSAFTQAIERAEPEYMKPCDKPSCKSCSYLRGQQDAKSDYKQRLLAEVK